MNENNNLHCLPHHRKLALELALGLNDIQALPLHLFFAQKYPEAFLRAKYNEVMTKPQDEIRTTRGRYYNYLVHRDGKEYIGNSRN